MVGGKKKIRSLDTEAMVFRGEAAVRAPYPGYPFTTYKYYPTYMYVPDYAYPEALRLIRESVGDEREDEQFYDYLLHVAPPEQQTVIASIRDDEIKHTRMFRQMYWELTGQDIPAAPKAGFQQPANYCDGIIRALFGELAAVARYRKILFGMRFMPYRNMVTEIYTDELMHATKWNYLYTLNGCAKRVP